MRRAILLLPALLMMILLLAACEADTAGLEATPQGDAGEEAAAPDQAGQANDAGEDTQGPPEGVNPPGLSQDGPPGQQGRDDDDGKPGQGPPEGVNPPGLSQDGPPGQQGRDDRDDDDQDADDQDEDDGTPRCTDGQASHPQIARLADQFNVSEEEIAAWYCAGRSLGDIKTAYRLSAQSGETVAALFAMRDQGMGWGAIKQALRLIGPPGGPPGRSPDDNDNTGPVPVVPEDEGENANEGG